MSDPTPGSTGWVRSAVLLVPGLAAVAVMAVAMAQGVLAASIGVSGRSFTITADSVQGEQVSGYPSTVTTADGKTQETLLLGFRTAQLKNLCLTAGATMPVVGDVAVRLRSGAGGTVDVRDFVADAEAVVGKQAALDDLEVGVDASVLSRGVRGATGPRGRFGLQASGLRVDDFGATAKAATGGSFRLSGIDLSVVRGKGSCG